MGGLTNPDAPKAAACARLHSLASAAAELLPRFPILSFDDWVPKRGSRFGLEPDIWCIRLRTIFGPNS